MRRARKRVGAIAGILLVAIAWGAPAVAATAPPPTILWNGRQWNVKSGTGLGPGNNSWSSANVFVDAHGDLHLALTYVGGTWYCAEVWTDATYGFGTFQ